MRSNRLQLNTAKTEALWCASTLQQQGIGKIDLNKIKIFTEKSDVSQIKNHF